MTGRANLFTIPASAAFADTLAGGLIRRLDAKRNPLALADTTIYLPTRRAVRTLSDAFARILGGAALLPEIRPLGNVDEDSFLFDPAAENLALLPAIAPMRRTLLLATLIAQWERARYGQEMEFARAVALARSLAEFLDDMQTHNGDMAALDSLAPAALAKHWVEARDFLSLLVTHWPGLLAAESVQDRAAHRNQTLAALARQLQACPPDRPIIAAGSTGSIPATAELLKIIAHLPQGAVILPGLDRHLDQSSWDALDSGHPQFGMRELLDHIGVARDAVQPWEGTPSTNAREMLLAEVLRPAPTTDAWQALAQAATDTIQAGMNGLSLLKTANPAEEAASIALILREALETKDRTAALVTPDRALARRVSAELKRWNIAIDDSAGLPLAHTPEGSFLCLIADVVQSRFSAVPLLALLKHPLASAGHDRKEHRRYVRELDLCLRGPLPDPGLSGIRAAIARKEIDLRAPCDPELRSWFETIAIIFTPLADLLDRGAPLNEIVCAHLETAEKLSATRTEDGGNRLWRREPGQSAHDLMARLCEATADLPPARGASYSGLFRQFAMEQPVRPRYGRHPRLAILGPLEARLQRFDVIVLGGLNEGTWPAFPSTDAWLSRPMRAALGLGSPERAIGLAAHDFATLAASPRVILTRTTKAEGAPTVESRWVQRLVQLARGMGAEALLASPVNYPALAAQLSSPAKVSRIAQPAPAPAVALRPRRLSVTEIETWVRDPYAIYARHVLKLRPLELLEAEFGPRERGTVIHRALEKFLRQFPDELPADAETRLMAIADAVFRDNAIPASVLAIWRPRFARAAGWFVARERSRRAEIVRRIVETKGEMIFSAPGGDFVLHGRADRIDELPGGTGAIIDYKTGAPPSKKQVTTILAPQLPLEAAMLAQGGFPDAGKLVPAELAYIRLDGGIRPGEVRNLDDAGTLADKAAKLLEERIMAFDRPEQAYLAHVLPMRVSIEGDYDHLARVREWSLSGWSEDTG